MDFTPSKEFGGLTYLKTSVHSNRLRNQEIQSMCAWERYTE